MSEYHEEIVKKKKLDCNNSREDFMFKITDMLDGCVKIISRVYITIRQNCKLFS
jgi:hypothetical protein